MPMFRKKPVVIEAMRFNGSQASFDRIWDWMGGDDGPNMGYSGTESEPESFGVKTLEGVMTCSCGDWVIKGVKGEFYPCKPDIFDATYEPVEERE